MEGTVDQNKEDNQELKFLRAHWTKGHRSRKTLKEAGLFVKWALEMSGFWS